MVLDTILLRTQHYKVRIKGKVEQSWERSSALPYTLVLVAIEKVAFEAPSTTVTNLFFVSKFGDLSWESPEGSLWKSYYTEK